MSGPGIIGTINIVGATPQNAGNPISIGSGGLTWDGIAQANSILRPLNGTYTVAVQCLDDGDPSGQSVFDRQVQFTGSSQTWQQLPTPPFPPPPTPDGVTLTPDFGSTLSDGVKFTVPAPGCAGDANAATATLRGPGLANVVNIVGAVPVSTGQEIKMSTGGVSWDGIALAHGLPRPLGGTYKVSIQCLLDGDPTNQSRFDRDVEFTKTGGTAPGNVGFWQAVNQPTPKPDEPIPANNYLAVSPGHGDSLTGHFAFQIPTPGCSDSSNSAVITMVGPGITGPNADGSRNVTGAVPVKPGHPVRISLGDMTWDALAVANGVPRPLQGRYRLTLQCLGDSSPDGQERSERDIDFIENGGDPGSAGTYQVVGELVFREPRETPTPTVVPATPTPTVDPQTPTPTVDPQTPTPTVKPETPTPTPVPLPSCVRGTPTPPGWHLIEGTPGDDRLSGTSGRDLIRGYGGNDIIAGLGGDDFLCGGTGDDIIAGGPGNDAIFGQYGRDFLYGGQGSDKLDGGAKADTLDGGPGDDLLVGGPGDDILHGGSGDDLLFGDAGNDRLYGDSGFDRLFGGPGVDILVPEGRASRSAARRDITRSGH